MHYSILTRQSENISSALQNQRVLLFDDFIMAEKLLYRSYGKE